MTTLIVPVYTLYSKISSEYLAFIAPHIALLLLFLPK